MTIRIVLVLLCIVGCGIMARVSIHGKLLRSYFRLSMFSWNYNNFRHQRPTDRVMKLSGTETLVRVASDDQGSLTIMTLAWLLGAWGFAHVYNFLLRISFPQLEQKHKLDGECKWTYSELIDVQYLLLIYAKALTLFIVLDMMLQDNLRCRHQYENWAKSLRRVWKGFPAIRIVGFWMYSLIVGAALFGMDCLSPIRLWIGSFEYQPSVFSSEIGRSAISASLLLFDIFIVIQDWEFPTFNTRREIDAPGLPVSIVSVWKTNVHFTAKWIAYTLTLWSILASGVCFFLQLTYKPSVFGQLVQEGDSYLYSITNQTVLDHMNCGYRCFNIPVNYNEPHQVQKLIVHFLDYPFIEKLPCLMIAIGSIVMFLVMMNYEKDRLVPDKRMVGARAKLYASQLAEASVAATATVHLKNLTQLKHLYARRKHIEDIGSAIALAGILLVILQNDAIWLTYLHSKQQNPDIVVEDASQGARPGTLYGLLIFLSTILLLILVVRRFVIECELLRLRHQISPMATIYNTPRLRRGLLLELLINALIVPPLLQGAFSNRQFHSRGSSSECPEGMIHVESSCFLEYTYPYEVLGVIMYLRLYWIGRVIRNHSGFHGQRSDFIGCLNNVSTESPWWNFRCLFHVAPIKVLIPILLLTWILTAVAVSIFERPITRGQVKSIWLTIVTMSTVGYGDVYPQTIGGRFILVIGGIVGGTIVISMLTSIFMGFLSTTHSEERVLAILSTRVWQKNVLDASSKVISFAWRHWRLKKQSDVTPAQLHASSKRFYRMIQCVRRLRYGKPAGAFDDQVQKLVVWQKAVLEPQLKEVEDTKKRVLVEIESVIQALEANFRH